MSDHDPLSPTRAAFDVGAQLLVLRQELGLSQRELARRAGMTNANLSMIEQGRVSPSVSTLEKILSALQLPLPEFFARSESRASEIYSRDRFIHIRRAGSEYRILPATAAVAAPAMAYQTLPSGATCSGGWPGLRSWISGVVINGEPHLWLDGVRQQLHPGDGFQFHLKRTHKFTNETPEPVVMVLASAEAIEPR